MPLRSTYTYTLLHVSKQTFEEVKARLQAADPKTYSELKPDEPLDMHGLALTVDCGEEAGKAAQKTL